jgi:1-acyl-sn-glycerol-3-phosphate acyltransferase
MTSSLPTLTHPPEPFVRRLARVSLGWWCRVSVEGLEHLPMSGPAIIASTHASHADSIALGLASPRKLSFLGDRRLLDWPLIGRWLPAFGMVPIERGHADLGALGAIGDALTAGEAVVLYPEGTRSRDGAVHRPRSGVARLAASSGAPVVPAGIVGTAGLWPVDTRPRLLGAEITVRFGPAIQAPSDTPAERRAWSRALQDELVRLSGAPRNDSFAPIRAA